MHNSSVKGSATSVGIDGANIVQPIPDPALLCSASKAREQGYIIYPWRITISSMFKRCMLEKHSCTKLKGRY